MAARNGWHPYRTVVTLGALLLGDLGPACAGLGEADVDCLLAAGDLLARSGAQGAGLLLVHRALHLLAALLAVLLPGGLLFLWHCLPPARASLQSARRGERPAARYFSPAAPGRDRPVSPARPGGSRPPKRRSP